MPIIDYAALPDFPMRAGITGKWIASHEHGAGNVGVLSNTVQPGAAAPLHRHDYEEVILIEAGEIWVEMNKVRQTARPGQCVIIPARTHGSSSRIARASSADTVMMATPASGPEGTGQRTAITPSARSETIRRWCSPSTTSTRPTTMI